MNSIPASVQTALEEFLQRKFHVPVVLAGFNAIEGGCINFCGRVQTTAGTFFLKWNNSQSYPEMLSTEAKGLQQLKSANVMAVPEVHHVGESGTFQFMLLEFIHHQPYSKTYWENFGRQLASLHRVSHKQFGLDHDNYIGSLPQVNSPESKWIDFFIRYRLHIQVDLAIKSNHFRLAIQKKFETLYKKLPDLLPEKKPSLLHGDLWSGNLLVNQAGEPCLIDPAVYFGHREADLAMTQLFGGFDDRYLNSYHEAFPLTAGFAHRIQLYNLYPLLVHVNLFGGGYIRQVNSILDHYVT